MKKYLDVRNFIIVFLLLVALLMFLNPKGFMPNRTLKVVQIDSISYPIYDTLIEEIEVEVEVPVEIEKEVRIEVEVPTPITVDTAAIVKMFSENKQTKKDILELPNNVGTVTLYDTISNNRILGRSFTSKIKQKILRDTLRIPEERKNVLYFGVDAKFDKPNVVNLIGTSMVMKTKTEKLYRVGVGVNNIVTDGTNGTFKPYIGGGVYWPIRFKKNKD